MGAITERIEGSRGVAVGKGSSQRIRIDFVVDSPPVAFTRERCVHSGGRLLGYLSLQSHRSYIRVCRSGLDHWTQVPKEVVLQHHRIATAKRVYVKWIRRWNLEYLCITPKPGLEVSVTEPSVSKQFQSIAKPVRRRTISAMGGLVWQHPLLMRGISVIGTWYEIRSP